MDGDKHRFGNYTHPVKNNGSWFFKPRPIFFENFLFSKTRQNQFLRDKLQFPQVFTCESKSNWENQITDISTLFLPRTAQIQDSEEVASNLAKLTAVCLMLGIVDLHYENLRFCHTDKGIFPVLVDVECYFWAAESGIESLLYPSKFSSLDKCGFRGQLDSPYKTNRLDVFFDSFIQTIEIVYDNFSELCDSIIEGQEEYVNRIILRPTRDYKKALELLDGDFSKSSVAALDSNIESANTFPFISEEIEQMKHGDIPYFFSKAPFSKDLFYFDSKTSHKKVNPVGFDKLLTHATPEKDYFYSEDRIQRLIVNSCLQLSEYFLADKEFYRIAGDSFKLIKSGNHSIQFECDWFQATTT